MCYHKDKEVVGLEIIYACGYWLQWFRCNNCYKVFSEQRF